VEGGSIHQRQISSHRCSMSPLLGAKKPPMLIALKTAGCGMALAAPKRTGCDVCNWNVRQATSQQVYKVTTFSINTCSQSFSTLVSRIVHHAVLKFSPCPNKPLSQAATRPYQYTLM